MRKLWHRLFHRDHGCWTCYPAENYARYIWSIRGDIAYGYPNTQSGGQG